MGNRSNLWSLSRGLAENKGRYFTGLQCTNPSPDPINPARFTFQSDNIAANCNIFLTICKEQIAFMEQQLMRDTIKARIEHFAETRLGTLFGKKKTDAGRVLRAVFSYGRLERQEACSGILGGLAREPRRASFPDCSRLATSNPTHNDQRSRSDSRQMHCRDISRASSTRPSCKRRKTANQHRPPQRRCRATTVALTWEAEACC